MSDHWIKTLLRDYWLASRKPEQAESLVDVVRESVKHQSPGKEWMKTFIRNRISSHQTENRLIISQGFLWWVWQVKVMFVIFKTFKLKATKHSKIIQISTLEKEGLIFEMVWETLCTNQGFSCSGETPWLKQVGEERVH